MSYDEIADFDAVMRALHTELYTWDLWGAAYVINGGASDDGFHYFKSWVIGQGRTIYEAAKTDPEDLASLIPSEGGGHVEFEEIEYVAREIWREKTGSFEMPSIDLLPRKAEPDGEPFENDAGSLRVRYPRLWQRFGEPPI